jgi:hypothetical protein
LGYDYRFPQLVPIKAEPDDETAKALMAAQLVEDQSFAES